MNNDRRLIEDFIPIKEISQESAREKSIRKGHISTLHLWWARRPLVAARAAVYASLIPAPETSQKRTALAKTMIDLCKWEADENTINKARKAILEAQRDRLGLPENTPLKEVPPPKVLDMFAGGGAIPLESLRLGCETYAIDLNPVAHIIQLCTLVYPQKYGQKLAQEVEKWGNWVIEKVRSEIGDLYPEIVVGEGIEDNKEQMELFEPQTKQLGLSFNRKLNPVAYLWTRTVKCPNPSCGASVPLVRQTWLCKKSKKYVALKVIPNHKTKKVDFEVVEATSEKELGFNPAEGSSRGNSTCSHCGTTVNVKYVKEEGKAGRIDQQLMAIVCTTPGAQGKTYLSGTDYQRYIPDEVAILERLDKLYKETGLTIPDEPLPDYGVLGFRVQPYGLVKWSHLFTPRQLLSLMTFVKWVRLAYKEIVNSGVDEELAKAICTYLGLMCDKQAMFNSSLGRWFNHREGICPVFSNQALPMVWDFIEGNPLCSGSGSWVSAQEYVAEVILTESKFNKSSILIRSSSLTISLDRKYLDAIITDPPYFDSVPYADLSDFFYVWLKRSIGHLYPEHFSGQLTPKKNEAIMEPSRHGGNKQKAAQAYQDMMHKAFCEANRVLKHDGIIAIVYAHKTTAGWTTLIDSLRRAGFIITEAFPLDTESRGRLRAQNSAALASSIFLIARKRTTSSVGDYASDVQPLLKQIIQERVKTLMENDVSGADLVIACVGAGLRAYTQYETVELPNGEELDASSFLDEVQKEVAETILKEVLGCDQKGVSAVDKPTQYYILARYEYGEAIVEFDEANVLARGVGVELDGAGGLTDGKLALVHKDKNKVKLRNYQERGKYEELGILNLEKQQRFNEKPQALGITPTLIDMLHRLLWLAENSPLEMNNFLIQAQPDAAKLRLVAQSLAGRALTANSLPLETDGENLQPATPRSAEQQAIDTLLASWKRTIEDNLFTRGG
jgi:putative DNA methylase